MMVTVDTEDLGFKEFATPKIIELLSKQPSLIKQYVFVDIKTHFASIDSVLQKWSSQVDRTESRIFVLVRAEGDSQLLNQSLSLFDHTIPRDKLLEMLSHYSNDLWQPIEAQFKLAVPFKAQGAYDGGVFAQSPIALAQKSQGEFWFQTVEKSFYLETEESVASPLDEKVFESSFKLFQPDQTHFKEFSKWLAVAEIKTDSQQAFVFPKKKFTQTKFKVALLSEDHALSQRLKESLLQEFPQVSFDQFNSTASFFEKYESFLHTSTLITKNNDFFSTENQTDHFQLHLNPKFEIQKVLMKHIYQTVNGISLEDLKSGKLDIFSFFSPEDATRVKEILFFLTNKNSITQFFQMKNSKRMQMCEVRFAKRTIAQRDVIEITIVPHLNQEAGGSEKQWDEAAYDLILLDHSLSSDPLSKESELLDGMQKLMNASKYEFKFPEVWHILNQRKNLNLKAFVKPLALPLLLQEMFLEFGLQSTSRTVSIPAKPVRDTLFALTPVMGQWTRFKIKMQSAVPLPLGRAIYFLRSTDKVKIVPYKVCSCETNGTGFNLVAECIDLL